jgi:hypothetical protein
MNSRRRTCADLDGKNLRLPVGVLIAMDVELLGQFFQRLLALIAAKATRALKAGCATPAWPIDSLSPLHSHFGCAQAGIHPSLCPNL